MASEEYAVLLEKIQARGTFEGDSVDAWRADMAKRTKYFVPPEGTVCTAVDANGVAAEWVVPEGVDESKTLLYFHGGGYAMGTLDTHRQLVALFAGAAGAASTSGSPVSRCIARHCSSVISTSRAWDPT